MSDLIVDLDFTDVEKEVMKEFIRLKQRESPILLLGAQEVSDLLTAKDHKISRPRAHAILSRLEEKNVLENIPRKGFTLTEYGDCVINELLHRMKLLESYFFEELEMPLELAVKEASNLVLHVSFVLIEVLCKKLGKPTKCPHDIKIPHHDKHPDYVKFLN